MELDSRVCSFKKNLSPRVVQLFCVGKVVLLLCLPPDLFSQLSFVFCTHRTGSHPHLRIRSCSSFGLQRHFKPVFQVQAGVFACSSCLITFLKVAAYQVTPKPSSCYPLQRDLSSAEILKESYIVLESCSHPCCILQIFSRTMTVPLSDQWASESQCFLLT